VFDQLRTKEQLGYIAQGYATHSVGIMSYRFLVQSERDPVYVETRIEAVLEYLRVFIEELKDDEFEKHRQALIAKKEEKPKNLGEEGRRFWGAIGDRFYEFGKRTSRFTLFSNTTLIHRRNGYCPLTQNDQSGRVKPLEHLPPPIFANPIQAIYAYAVNEHWWRYQIRPDIGPTAH